MITVKEGLFEGKNSDYKAIAYRKRRFNMLTW